MTSNLTSPYAVLWKQTVVFINSNCNKKKKGFHAAIVLWAIGNGSTRVIFEKIRPYDTFKSYCENCPYILDFHNHFWSIRATWTIIMLVDVTSDWEMKYSRLKKISKPLFARNHYRIIVNILDELNGCFELDFITMELKIEMWN